MVWLLCRLLYKLIIMNHQRCCSFSFHMLQPLLFHEQFFVLLWVLGFQDSLAWAPSPLPLEQSSQGSVIPCLGRPPPPWNRSAPLLTQQCPLSFFNPHPRIFFSIGFQTQWKESGRGREGNINMRLIDWLDQTHNRNEICALDWGSNPWHFDLRANALSIEPLARAP